MKCLTHINDMGCRRRIDLAQEKPDSRYGSNGLDRIPRILEQDNGLRDCRVAAGGDLAVGELVDETSMRWGKGYFSEMHAQ
jgi:hypothetical protein